MSYTSKRSGKVTQGNTSSISTSNTQLATSHKLDFMLESSGQVFNDRVSLPSTKAIISFNQSGRDKTFTKGSQDMSTLQAKRVKKAKFKLQAQNASRNHKLSDSFGGDLINRSIIMARTGSKQDRDSISKGFQQLSDSMYQPMAKQSKRISKKRKNMEDSFSQLIDPTKKLKPKEYQKLFKSVKSGLTSALPNLRIGDSSLNSGIGASFDPNLSSMNGPPSPISHSIQTAVDTFSSMPELSLNQSQQQSVSTAAKMGPKFVSSSHI